MKDVPEIVIKHEIARRQRRAIALADRFADLPTEDYTAFLLASDAAGLELDFVTSCALFDELQRRRKAS
jgi:hypothetical protein